MPIHLRNLLLPALALLAAAVPLRAQNYTFTLVAGVIGQNGTADGTGANARFNGPRGLSADSAGNLYVADANVRPSAGGGPGAVRKVTSSAVVTTVPLVPQSTESAATIYDTAVDQFDNAYATYTRGFEGMDLIYKITPTGSQSVITPTPADFVDDLVSGIAIESDGSILITAPVTGGVWRIAPSGAATKVAQTVAGQSAGPRGICVDTTGNIYVTLPTAGRVIKLTSSGQFSGNVSQSSGSNPFGLDIDRLGNVHVGSNSNLLYRIAPNGMVSTFTINDAQSVRGVAVDPIGNVFVADETSNVIWRGAISQPINDAFAWAAPMNSGSGRILALTGASTREDGEPHHANQPDGHSLWWKFSATQAGVLTVNTEGSDFDTVLAAYAGSSLATLDLIKANDDHDSLLASAVAIRCAPGTDYYLTADGAGGRSGELVFAWQFFPAATVPLDVWKQSVFNETEMADSAISSNDAAPAGDGITNLVKYAFDLNPLANETGQLPVPQVVDGALTLDYTALRADLQYVRRYLRTS